MADEKVVITLILDDKEVTGTLKGLPDKFGETGRKAGDSFSAKFKKRINQGFSNLNRNLGNSLTNMLKLQAAAVAFGSAFFLKSAIKEAANLERSLRGLNSIASNFGVDTEKLNTAVQDLASDGMIPLNNITETFKNLLRSTDGDLEQTVTSFKAFRDSATNNREAQYSLGEAIVATSQGIKNQNSIKSDAIGVSDNLSQVNKRYAESLGKNISQLSDQQKQLGSTIGLTKLAGISAGDYARSLNDFDGIMSKIGGEFTKFQQNIGKFVTKSPVLLKIFKDIGKSFGTLNKDLVDFVNQGGIQQVTIKMLDFAKTFTQSVLKPISYVSDVFDIVFKSVALGVQGILLAFIGMANGIGKILRNIGIQSDWIDNLQGLTDATKITASDMKEDLKTSFDEAFGTDNLDKLIGFVEVYRNEISKVPETSKIIAKNNKDIVDNTKKTATALGKIVKNGIVKVISSSMQELGRVLVQGGFSFKSFGAIVIGAMGDLAIQMGTMIVAADAAMKALESSVGGAAGKGIIYGAALIAVGGAMKAYAGGMGGGSASGSGSSASSSPTGTIEDPTFTQDSPVTRTEEQPGIIVNIKGDVLDSTETGMRVVDIINKAYDQEGVVINRGAIA